MNSLIFLFIGLLAFVGEVEVPEAEVRNDIDPVAVLTSNPGGSMFYNLADIIFSSGNSYDDDGYITQSKFYINGQYVYGSSYTSGYTECFALYGSPAGDCFDMPSGASTVSVKLEVQDNDGNWDDVTEVYTIQEHKGRKYFVKDHLGSVRTTVNRDGNVLGFDDYYPFGLAMDGGHNENTANPSDNYKFTGHERDDEAGLTLDYMNARNYDPVLGRFMQVDPLAQEFPDISPYAYGNNNPLKFTDPTGMAPEECPNPPCGNLSFEAVARYVMAPLENLFNNKTEQVEHGAKRTGEVVSKTAEKVIKEGPEALDVANKAAVQTTAITVSAASVVALTPGPHDDVGALTAVNLSVGLTVATDFGATVLSGIDAALLGGSEEEANLRAQLTLFGISSSYGASMVYGTSLKQSILSSTKKEILKKSAGAIGSGVAVEALKNKN